MQAGDFGVMEIDGEGRVLRLVEKPEALPTIPSNPGKSLVPMGIHVFNTHTVVRALIRDAEDRHSSHDFGKDIIPTMIGRGQSLRPSLPRRKQLIS